MRQNRVVMGMLVVALAGASASAGTWFGPPSGHINAPTPHFAPVDVATSLHGEKSTRPFPALVGLVRTDAANQAELSDTLDVSLPQVQMLHLHLGGLGAIHVNRNDAQGPGILRPQPSSPRPLPDLNEVPTIPGPTNDSIDNDAQMPSIGAPASEQFVERALPIVPLPSAAGIGFLGLGALAARRRR